MVSLLTPRILETSTPEYPSWMSLIASVLNLLEYFFLLFLVVVLRDFFLGFGWAFSLS